MLYSFRMPLFVFASGVVLAMSFTRRAATDTLRSLPSFAADKFKRLLIPYFVIMAIVAVPRFLLNGFADDDVNLTIGNFIGTDELIISLYWFLPFSFILMCAGYAGMQLFGNQRMAWMFVLILPVAAYLMLGHIGWDIRLFSFGNVCRLGIYFFLGMTYGFYKDMVDSRIPWASIPMCAACFGAWLVLSQYIEGALSMLLCGIAGILMVLSFVNLMVKRGWKFLDFFEGSTYMIFLLSWFPGTAFQQILSHLVKLPWWVYTILAFAGGVLLPVIVYRWLVLKPANTRLRRGLLFILGHKPKK